ncbi:MAG: Fe-S cluster assembly protein SufD [Bacteroidales bacterium]|nr:MAG: Fe-S cluster assembly protein SufD [Bacteroidales bacterium]
MGETLQITNWNEELSDIFNRNSTLLRKGSPDYVNENRDRGIAQFRKLGIPDSSNENYKYLNLDFVYKQQFQDYLMPEKVNFDINHIFQCDIPTLDTHVVTLLNGFYFDRSRPISDLHSGALAGSLNYAFRKIPDLVKKHFGRYAKMEKEGLVAWNSAFSNDGIFIYVPDGVVLRKPIQIVNLLLSNSNLRVQHRNLFILGENAHATVIVCDHTLSDNRFVTNSVTEIFAGENAGLDYIKVQNEHNLATKLSNLYIHQERNSRVNTNTITLHGGVVRNNVHVVLDGKGCESNIKGLYLVDKGQHVDNYIFVDHAKPECTSNQLYKGVLDDFATGAFNGRILVRKDAQKTKAFQANNNILLTDDAKMNTKPQLEIYADDVKCSHGATVGQLDEDALFYLRTRGIEENEARLMLMYAFAHEIIAGINVEPLSARIDDLVDKRLRGELSRCANCAINCR